MTWYAVCKAIQGRRHKGKGSDSGAKQYRGLEVCPCTTLELKTWVHTHGCDANHPAGIKSSEAECSCFGVGRWVALSVNVDQVSVMEWLQPDLEGRHQNLHFIYVLHITT